MPGASPSIFEYAVHDGIRLTGDFYRPVGAANAPVLLAVHGGAWKLGSSERYRHWGPWLSAQGIALFAINYRLVARRENRHPAALEDVRAALHFLHANAQELGVAPSRIGIVGDSAGAHLAALAALTAAPGLVKAVVGVYGVYDLLAQWQHDQIARPTDQIAEALIGVSPLDDRLPYLLASPLTHVTRRTNHLSFLVAWGTDDDVVDCATQSIPFVTALKQAGYFTRTVPVMGGPHYWMADPIDESASHSGFLAPRMLRFLTERL